MLNVLSDFLEIHSGLEEWILTVTKAINVVSGASKLDIEKANTFRVEFSSFSLHQDVLTINASNKRPDSELHDWLLKATEKTCLVRNVSMALLNADATDNQLECLKCISRLSALNENMPHLIQEGTIKLVCGMINQPEISAYCIENVWNALESERGYTVAADLACDEIFHVLKQTFELLTLKGHRQQDKQMRNELVIIMTFIVQLYPASLQLFREAELQDCVTLFLTHAELNIQEQMLQNFVLVIKIDVDKWS